MIFAKVLKVMNTLNCKMSSSPDTFFVLLIKFTFMVWGTASQSFLQTKQNILNYLITVINCVLAFCITIVFGCFHNVMALFKLVKHVHKFEYIVHSSVWLSNHTWSESMHNMSAHQLPWYYHPQWVIFMACIALITRYACCKLAHTTKILQNVWLTLVLHWISGIFVCKHNYY